MRKKIIILSLMVITSYFSYAQSSTLTRKLVNGKYGWGYPSLTKKDGMGYPLVESLAIPAIYDESSPVTFAEEYENLIAVELNGKWGYIDATGATKLPFKWELAGYFHEGLAPVKLDGKVGFIDKTGSIILPYKWEDVDGFYDGISRVELGGKVGYINKKGEVVIPIKYDRLTNATDIKCSHCGPIYSFHDGKTTVVLNGKCGIIDLKGNFTPCEDLPEMIIDSITFSGTVNTKKDLWGGNPGATFSCDCDLSVSVKRMSLNNAPIFTYTSSYKDNKMMHVGFDVKWKPGQPVAIKIVYKKGCTLKLSGDQGFDLKEGQHYEAKDFKQADVLPGLDSTIFSGTINIRMMAIIQSSDGAQDIKKIILNDVDISSKLHPAQRQIINFGIYKLKNGQDVTIKVIHTKGSTVKMLDPKGIDID